MPRRAMSPIHALLPGLIAAMIGPAQMAQAYRPVSPVEYLEMGYILEEYLDLIPQPFFLQPPTIVVPDHYPSVQEAVDHAWHYNQKILVKEPATGYYNENVVIDAQDFINLTIEGECDRLPEIRSAEYGRPVIHIRNEDNIPTTINVRSLTLTGASGYDVAGLQVTTSDDSYDAVTTTVNLSRVHLTDNTVGIQTGSRLGTHSCAGNWGSVNATLLDQPITQISIDRCTVIGNRSDGMNLWRAQGEILSTLVANNGGEGIHTTHFSGIARNNVIIGHNDNQFHLHFPRNTSFTNNLVAAGVGSVASPGDGLVISGFDPLDAGAVLADNNVFAGNDGAGLRLGLCRLVDNTSGCVEEVYPTSARVRNNVFFDNSEFGERYALHTSHSQVNTFPAYARYNLFFRNRGRNYNPRLVDLGAGNRFGENPDFITAPDAQVIQALLDPQLIRTHAMGVRPLAFSPLVDGGDPGAQFNDISTYAEGTTRNDIGLFGGPDASPGPLSAGARPRQCLNVTIDWIRDRAFIIEPLFLEPGGNPWLDTIPLKDEKGNVLFNLYWTPEGIKSKWLGKAQDISSHQLGHAPIKRYITEEDRKALRPVTLEKEFEIKYPRYEEDDPLPGS